MQLSDYAITPQRGFLSPFEAATVTLPRAFAPVVETALALPRLLPTGRVRHFIARLPVLDVAPLLGTPEDAAARVALVHYSFLVQAHVWGEPDPPQALPEALARPVWALAHHLKQMPLLQYSSYVLDNWGLIEPERPLALDNIFMFQPFLGGQDEAWFVLVHVAIEAEAGAALAEVPGLIAAARAGDGAALAAGLTRLASVWARINAIFDRMPERCDPHTYFTRVRPYIHGWKDNPALPDGLVYAGVAETGGRRQAFRGQTGSQSSIVPAMDALFGLGHADDPLRQFLDELHAYRPAAQRRFIEDVRAQSGLRAAVSAHGRDLARLYNACVRAVAAFRTRHLEYAARYIAAQARSGPGNDTAVGTGGTPFMVYLKKHRDETEAQLLPE